MRTSSPPLIRITAPLLQRTDSAPARLQTNGQPEINQKLEDAKSAFKKQKSTMMHHFPPLAPEVMKALQEKVDNIDDTKPLHEAIENKREIVQEYFGYDNIIEALSQLYKEYTLFKRDADGQEIGLKDKSPDNKKIHIVGGPPGSGKSTKVRHIEQKDPDKIVMVDPDFLVTMHPQFQQIKKLFGRQWGEVSTVINRPVREKIIEKLCQDGYQICVEGSKSFGNYIPEALSSGYAAKLYLPLAPYAELHRRSAKRMADQKNAGKPIRGIELQDYEHPEKGHHALAMEAAKDFFKIFSPHIAPPSGKEPKIEVILQTQTLDGQEGKVSVTSFEQFLEQVSAVNDDSQTATEQVEKLRNNKSYSFKTHYHRILQTYLDLQKSGCKLEKILPYLDTVSVEIDNQDSYKHLPAFDSKDVSILGNHHTVLGQYSDMPERTAAEIKRTMDIHGDGVLSQKQYKDLQKRYVIKETHVTQEAPF